MCSRTGMLVLSALCSCIVFAALCSCSVLEGRESCPCLLHLDVDESTVSVTDSVRIWILGDGFSYTAVLSSSDYAEGMTVPVATRSGVYVTVMDSASAGDSRDGMLSIPPGGQCPEVFDFRNFCDTSGEAAEQHIQLHKNHCRVSVSFPEAVSGGYSLEIAGNVNGYTSQGEMMDGEFVCEPYIDGEDRFVFCIPRQRDGSLNMTISRGDGPPRVFAIGNYILDIGYDWTAVDLADVEISVDYAAGELRLHIEGWTDSGAVDLVI